MIGDEAKARRLSAVLAGQLIERGLPMTVVGRTVGDRVADACTAGSLTEAETATDDPTAVQIIFCGSEPDDTPVLRRLIARTSPRTIVVLVGKVPPGRWSIEVHRGAMASGRMDSLPVAIIPRSPPETRRPGQPVGWAPSR